MLTAKNHFKRVQDGESCIAEFAVITLNELQSEKRLHSFIRCDGYDRYIGKAFSYRYEHGISVPELSLKRKKIGGTARYSTCPI